jgi:hypothetical protein
VVAGGEGHRCSLRHLWPAPRCAWRNSILPYPGFILHGHSTPPSFREAPQEFARKHGCFRARESDAQSHFPMSDVPEDMARMIDEFIG